MSCSLWRWTEECDNGFCAGDCDLCEKETGMSEDYLNGAKAAWEMAQDIMCMNKKDLLEFDATKPKE